MNKENFAIKALEYDKILEMLAGFAATRGGAELALNMCPSTSFDEISRLLDETSAAKELLAVKGSPSFFSVDKIDDTLERASKSASLSIPELINISDLLSAVKSCRTYGKGLKEDNRLFALFDSLFPLKELDERLKDTFTADGTVADTASPALASIRRKIRNMGSKIRDNLQRYVSSPIYSKYLQDNIITTRGSRYVLAVKADCKNEIKGLVHDASSSGATLFIEPASVVELNNEIKIAENEEKAECEKILRELSALCAESSVMLRADFEIVTNIDFIIARAKLSEKMDGIRPELTESGEMRLVGARHPLIARDKVVPVSINVGENFDMLVITGPNTGGKTVSLKIAGLFSMLAQSGLHIPACDGSKIRIFSGIYADIGDEQSIEQSLSTFSSHMTNIIDILAKTDERSLVLLDELGAGTDPSEGAALAISILERIRSSGALCIATTHYAELKIYALETEGVVNGACEFDIKTLKPTYRLTIGAPGRSNAFLICERLGMDKSIVEAARSYISSDAQRFENVIEGLEASRVEAERFRDEAERMHTEIKTKFDKSFEEREKLLEDARLELERAKTEAQRLIRSAKASSEYVFAELDKLKKAKDREDMREAMSAARAALSTELKSAEKKADINTDRKVEAKPLEKIAVGDRVFVLGIEQDGVIEKIDGNNVTVKMDRMSVKVKKSSLTAPRTAEKPKKKQGTSYAPRRPDVKPEIDLRGQTGDDAWFMVDKYLDDAKMGNLSIVTLIHGKGTGALRSALWRYLKSDKRVESFRAGAYGEGDYGVTVVTLK